MKNNAKLAGGITAMVGVILVAGATLWFWHTRQTQAYPNIAPSGALPGQSSPDHTLSADGNGQSPLSDPWRVRVKGDGVIPAETAVVFALRSGKWVKAEPLSPGLYRPGVSRGSVERVFAVAPGWRSPVEPVTGATGDITLTLAPSARIRVRVEDNAGKPVASAWLSLSLGDVATSADWLHAVELGLGMNAARTLTTDTEGISLLPALLPGSWLQVTAQNDFGLASGEIDEVADEDELVLKLADGGTRVTVRCVRLDGSAACGLAFYYKLLTGSSEKPTRAGEGACSTDEAGVARVYLGEASALFLTGVEDGWRFQERPPALSAERLEAEVTLLREFPLQVRITYDDGRPYVGNASVWTKSGVWSAKPGESAVKDVGGGPSDILSIDETGAFTIPHVVEGDGVDLTGWAQGAEYGGSFNRKLSVTDASDGSVWQIVIPKLQKERTPGVIRLTGPGASSGSVIIIDDPWENPIENFDLSRKKESRGLPERSYRVRVSGENIGWESEIIELHNGDTKELQVPEQAPGRVSALITDKDGNPLKGATITPWSRGHAAFPMDPVPYIFAVSGSDGVAQLGGQPPGKQKYRIEAAGMQFQAETADVFSGETADLGRVVLIPAVGEIRVTLVGDVPVGERVEFRLETPFGRRGGVVSNQRQDISGGKSGFSHLVVDRWYIITLLQYDKNEDLVAQYIINNVKLTTEETSLEFTVHLADFKRD